MVNIAASHAAARGSIPRIRIFFLPATLRRALRSVLLIVIPTDMTIGEAHRYSAS